MTTLEIVVPAGATVLTTLVTRWFYLRRAVTLAKITSDERSGASDRDELKSLHAEFRAELRELRADYMLKREEHLKTQGELLRCEIERDRLRDMLRECYGLDTDDHIEEETRW